MSEQMLQKTPPAPDPSASMNAQIFTMPEAYRYGKDVKLVEPASIQKPFVAPATPAPARSLPTTPLPTPKQGTTFSVSKALFIAGGVVFIGLAIGGFLVWRSGATKPVAPVVQQAPAPQPAPRAPETPIVTPPTNPTPPAQPTQSPFATALTPGKDSDSDGLTDVEEQLIYKTNPNLPDTDSDGFLDGNEVFHRYNPGGTAPGTLLEAKLVQLYTNADGLEILYPATWTLDTTTPDTSSFTTQSVHSVVRFRAPSGEAIKLSAYDLLTPEVLQAFLLEWVTKQGGQEQVIKTKTKDGNELYITRDQLKAFVSLGNRPVLFEYETGTVGSIEYTQTFQMMMNSLKNK